MSRATNVVLLCTLVVLLSSSRASALVADRNETDDSFATAAPILSGVTQTHSLAVAEVIYVTFNLTAASDVIIQTDTNGSAADTVLRLYDSTQTQIAWDDDGNPAGNLTSRITASNLAAGLYYASVESYGLSTGTSKKIKSYFLTAVWGPPGTPFPPLYTGRPSVNAAVGAQFSYPATTIGSLPVVYTASALPPGLSLNGPYITGVPTLAGTYSVTLTATNGTPPNATATVAIVTITVSQGGVIATVAGTGKSGFGAEKVQAVRSALNSPRGVVVDSTGNIYFADQGNNRIRRVDAVTGLIQTVAGNGTPAFSGDTGPATLASLNGPTGLALDASNNLYIADAGNNCVRMMAGTTGVITTIAGTGVAGFSGDGGPAYLAALKGPTALAFVSSALAFTSSGNLGILYVADSGNNRIRKLSNVGIQTIAGNGAAAFSGDSGPAAAASLNSPFGVAADSAGNVFISDSKNQRLRKVDPSGIITTIAGTGTAGDSGDGGPALSAKLDTPHGLALDATGLYVADTNNDRVRRIDLASKTISAAAGDGTPDFTGDGGLAVLATLQSPRAVAEDSAGYFYVSDEGNSRIRRVGLAIAPTITSPATANGAMNVIFTPYRVTVTGHPPPAVTVDDLPPGLSLYEKLITGVPAVSGAVDATLSATNSVGTAQLVVRFLLAGAPGSSNTPPAFTSPPSFITATPNPGVSGTVVNFVAPVAGDTDGDLLAYTWNFGDPNDTSTAIGAVAAHLYSAPGVYTVTVTVSDGTAGIVASMALGVNDPSVTQPLIISKAQLKLNFKKTNSDSLTVSGTIPLRDKFTPAGQTARFYFGNLYRNFPLNNKGTVTSKTDIFKLVANQKPGVFIDQAKQFFTGSFSVTLKGQTLWTDPGISSLGFVKNVTNSVPLTVPVLVAINNDNYLQNVTFLYKSSSTSGSATKLSAGGALPTRGGP